MRYRETQRLPSTSGTVGRKVALSQDVSLMSQGQQIAFVIDDDRSVREGLSSLLRSVDIAVETFGSAKDFLQSKRPDVPACLILDVRLPGMSGLEFQEELGKLGCSIPSVRVRRQHALGHHRG